MDVGGTVVVTYVLSWTSCHPERCYGVLVLVGSSLRQCTDGANAQYAEAWSSCCPSCWLSVG